MFPGTQTRSALPEAVFLLHSSYDLLDLIPVDRICFHMYVETCSVSTVNRHILRLICIIDYAVFAVFHICMYFHIIIGTEPFLQIFLISGSPDHRAVQKTAVLKAVRKTADIHTSSLSECTDCHLYFVVFLHKDLCSVQRIHIFLPSPLQSSMIK